MQVTRNLEEAEQRHQPEDPKETQIEKNEIEWQEREQVNNGHRLSYILEPSFNRVTEFRIFYDGVYTCYIFNREEDDCEVFKFYKECVIFTTYFLHRVCYNRKDVEDNNGNEAELENTFNDAAFLRRFQCQVESLAQCHAIACV